MTGLRANRRQTGILSDRYLEVLVGDARGVLLLLLQAPLIALLISGVWANLDSDSLTLYFVLCLSAFFLGAINASREVVKERDLFLRERMFNLSVPAYVQSKFRVQLMLTIIASVALAGIVSWQIPLQVNLLAVGAALVLTGTCGTAVGLLISSIVRSSDKAVMAVPLVVIPQILLSDFVLGGSDFSNWTGTARELMPVHWGYEMLEALRAADISYGSVFASVAVLVLMVIFCYFATVLLLKRARY